MKIGVFGGSFDPIHTGHAILANYIAQSGLVDELWLMVTRRNPLKDKTFASEQDRFEMARIVSDSCEKVKASDFEFHLSMPSYTYKTLEGLKEKFPENQFKIIIGSDSLLTFNKWRNYENIVREFEIIVYPRPHFPLPEKEPDNFTFLKEVPLNGLSSSFVRECVKKGWNIEFFVPEKVREYIIQKKLYR